MFKPQRESVKRREAKERDWVYTVATLCGIILGLIATAILWSIMDV